MAEELRQSQQSQKKKQSKDFVLKTVLVSLFKRAEKDLQQLEQKHIEDLEKLEKEKKSKKDKTIEEHNSNLDRISRYQEILKQMKDPLAKSLELYTSYSKQDPSKVDRKQSDRLLSEYQKKQKEFDEIVKKIEDSKKKYSEESHLRKIEEIEKEHTQKKEKLEDEHKKKVSKYAKGNGFKPLSSYPHHIIAGALNKNYLRYRHLIPNQNEYNREQAHKLTHQAVKNAHGGNIFDSFLSGIATPFRLARNINPAFDFGVGTVADALGVPTISQVINK